MTHSNTPRWRDPHYLLLLAWLPIWAASRGWPGRWLARLLGIRRKHMSDLPPILLEDDSESLIIILHAVINALRTPGGGAGSRSRALALARIQEATFWLTEDAALNAEHPPRSFRAKETVFNSGLDEQQLKAELDSIKPE